MLCRIACIDDERTEGLRCPDHAENGGRWPSAGRTRWAGRCCCGSPRPRRPPTRGCRRRRFRRLPGCSPTPPSTAASARPEGSHDCRQGDPGRYRAGHYRGITVNRAEVAPLATRSGFPFTLPTQPGSTAQRPRRSDSAHTKQGEWRGVVKQGQDDGCITIIIVCANSIEIQPFSPPLDIITYCGETCW